MEPEHTQQTWYMWLGHQPVCKGEVIFISQKQMKKHLESEYNFEYSYKPDFHCHSFVWLLKLWLSPHNLEVSLIGQTPEDQHCNE
jgi:hypothetical protein